MTAPTPTPTPTPATLDAAVEAALADRARALYAWSARIDLLREVEQLRADAAGHADQLAQAHAAGAAGERERIVAYLDGRRDRIGFSAQVDKGIRWALNSIRMMPVGWQPKVTGACRLDAHADCRSAICICACHIARAGTSEADHG